MQHALPFDTPDDRPAAPWSPMEGIVVLPGFADGAMAMRHVEAVAARAPFRHMVTPGGHPMSAAMTNCGALGWVSDRKGYRYTAHDPESGRPWPVMPEALKTIAVRAAQVAGFPGFEPDACLINRYAPGARMGLHQDKDEADFSQPVVTLSLGLRGIFQLAGAKRTGPGTDVPLDDGDMLVMGGPARLYFHGIRMVKAAGESPNGDYRVSLTFRRAGGPHGRQ